MLHELFLKKKLVFSPHSLPLTLTYFPNYVRNPEPRWGTQYPMRFFRYIGVTCNDPRYCSRRCFSVVEFYRFLNVRKSLFFFFWEKRRWESNQRPHYCCSWSHVLPWTPLWGSSLKMLHNKCYSSFFLLNSFFCHTGHKKSKKESR